MPEPLGPAPAVSLEVAEEVDDAETNLSPSDEAASGDDDELWSNIFPSRACSGLEYEEGGDGIRFASLRVTDHRFTVLRAALGSPSPMVAVYAPLVVGLPLAGRMHARM